MGLLLLLVARAAWVAEAVRRLPGGVGAPWRMLMEPSQTAAIDRAFEVLGRRGLAADAAYVQRVVSMLHTYMCMCKADQARS